MYFDNLNNQVKLLTVLKSWEGTPHIHWCGVKQRGTDCIHFVLRVFEEVGVVPNGRIKVQRYQRDWHMHQANELLLNTLREVPELVEVCKDDPVNGDIILFYFGKACSHAGIFFDDFVYQSLVDIGVTRGTWKDDMWYPRRRYAFRAK